VRGRWRIGPFDEAGEQHLLLHLDAEVAACDALQRHDEDVSAVEDRHRQPYGLLIFAVRRNDATKADFANCRHGLHVGQRVKGSRTCRLRTNEHRGDKRAELPQPPMETSEHGPR